MNVFDNVFDDAEVIGITPLIAMQNKKSDRAIMYNSQHLVFKIITKHQSIEIMSNPFEWLPDPQPSPVKDLEVSNEYNRYVLEYVALYKKIWDKCTPSEVGNYPKFILRMEEDSRKNLESNQSKILFGPNSGGNLK